MKDFIIYNSDILMGIAIALLLLAFACAVATIIEVIINWSDQ